jgi:hypothetical protein
VGVFAAPADPGRDDAQIANTINDVLKSQGVGVIIKATHHYMTTRGVHKPGMEPVTRMSGFGAKRTFAKATTSLIHAILGQRETLLVFGRLRERAPLKRYIYWSQQLLLTFYSASERGDHQGNTMIP